MTFFKSSTTDTEAVAVAISSLFESVKPTHILIVEDDDDARHFFAATLRSAGYTVSEVATVEESRQVLHREAIALALLDWYLPDGTATVICEEIERHNRAAPIILITGQADLRTFEVDNCRVDLWLHKPTTVEKLLAAVHQLLEPQAAAPDPTEGLRV